MHLTSIEGIDADLNRAMVATAPGEKLLIGRHPVRNPTFFFFLFHCERRVIIYRCHWCHDLQSTQWVNLPYLKMYTLVIKLEMKVQWFKVHSKAKSGLSLTHLYQYNRWA